jgi:hypothetical protein
MLKEINRNTWSKFCRKFSSENRYRQFNVNVTGQNRKNDKIVWDSPFMGMALEKNGRLIDGIRLFSAWADPKSAALPTASFKQPVKIMLEKDKNGIDHKLMVHTKDGMEALIKLTGDKDPGKHYSLVEKIAYSMYEWRGHSHGNDEGDWIEAEKKVAEAEMQFS